MNDIRQPFLHPLQTLLSDQFGASATDFARQVQQAVEQLPDELAAELKELAGRLGTEDPSSASTARFAFDCGCLYERLRSWRHHQLAAEAGTVSPEGKLPDSLEQEQMDSLARIIAARDRIFRKVADFTLKAILITLGLLALGMLLGVV